MQMRPIKSIPTQSLCRPANPVGHLKIVYFCLCVRERANRIDTHDIIYTKNNFAYARARSVENDFVNKFAKRQFRDSDEMSRILNARSLGDAGEQPPPQRERMSGSVFSLSLARRSVQRDLIKVRSDLVRQQRQQRVAECVGTGRAITTKKQPPIIFFHCAPVDRRSVSFSFGIFCSPSGWPAHICIWDTPHSAYMHLMQAYINWIRAAESCRAQQPIAKIHEIFILLCSFKFSSKWMRWMRDWQIQLRD